MAAENFVGSEMDGYIDCHCHLADDMFNNVSNDMNTNSTKATGSQTPKQRKSLYISRK
jgi:imidazolonepropionase-like amidohydrolase